MKEEVDIIALIEKYQSLHLSDIIHHDKFLHYALTFHSTAIEGSILTEMETRLLLDDGITPGGKPLEHSQMVKDHFDALGFTREQAQSKIIDWMADEHTTYIFDDRSLLPKGRKQYRKAVM